MYGAIVYLLTLPEVHKVIAETCCGMKVKLNMTHYPSYMLHGVVFAVLYYILSHFI